ncbi:hypothetical protein BGZ65_002828, partial [Modicella reniformis]
HKDWWFDLDLAETVPLEDPEFRLSDESDSVGEEEEAAQPMKEDTIFADQEDTLQPIQHGFQRIKPKSFFQSRTRFCSISGDPPSPQDFFGEADLPYPLPSTLQERQARQQKRAEQLRQLKIREEREAPENRRRVRRRGASFSAGMYSDFATPQSSPTPSLSNPPLSLSRSLSSVSPSTWLGQNRSLVKGNITSRRSRRCVGFDLRKTKVIEYAVEEPCSRPCSPMAGQNDQSGEGSSPECSDHEGNREDDTDVEMEDA